MTKTAKRLVVSALLKRVYWALVNKDGMMGDGKIDVTDQFLGCVIDYFGPDTICRIKDLGDGSDLTLLLAKKPDLVNEINELLDKRKEKLLAPAVANWTIDVEWINAPDKKLVVINNDDKSPLYGWGAIPPARAKELTSGDVEVIVAAPPCQSTGATTHETMKTECTFEKGTMPDWVVDVFRISYEYCLRQQKRLKGVDTKEE